MMAGGCWAIGWRPATLRGALRAALYGMAASVPFLIVLLAQPRRAMASVPVLAGSGPSCSTLLRAGHATLQDIVAPGSVVRPWPLLLRLYLLGAAVGPVGTGVLSDRLAARAALRLGLPAGAEAAARRAAPGSAHRAALGLLLAWSVMATRTWRPIAAPSARGCERAPMKAGG